MTIDQIYEMGDIGMLVAIDRQIQKEEANKDVELNPELWSVNGKGGKK